MHLKGRSNGADFRYLLALVILFLLLVFSALGADYEPDYDLPVDGKLRQKQAVPAFVPPTPETPPPPPPPPEQEDVKPPTIYSTELPSENGTVYFVIDVSGSMALDLLPDADGNWLDRLGRAKAELIRCVERLPDTFKFGMASFDCDTYFWLGEPVKADRTNKDRAIAWIAALKPMGSTGTGNAVGQVVTRYPDNKLVVLLNDGAPNCHSFYWNGNVPPETHRQDIKLANKAGANAVINVFGISTTGQAMRDFCQGVASDNGGTYSDVR